MFPAAVTSQGTVSGPFSLSLVPVIIGKTVYVCCLGVWLKGAALAWYV